MRSNTPVRSSRASPVSGRAEARFLRPGCFCGGSAVSSLLRVPHPSAFCASRGSGHFVAQRRPCEGLGICSVIVFLCVIVAVVSTANRTFAADKPVAWKPIPQALLRVDDQPVKNWNVYMENKKSDPLLLQMGNRFLLIQVHARKIFELAPAKIEHKGTELLWDPANLPAEPLATSNWIIRDVGFAYRIDARLVAENHVVDLQLPHPMDLRYL